MGFSELVHLSQNAVLQVLVVCENQLRAIVAGDLVTCHAYKPQPGIKQSKPHVALTRGQGHRRRYHSLGQGPWNHSH
jgi:hypothetical protein